MLVRAHSRARLNSRSEVGPSSSFKTKSQIGKQPAPHSEGGAAVSDDARRQRPLLRTCIRPPGPTGAAALKTRHTGALDVTTHVPTRIARVPFSRGPRPAEHFYARDCSRGAQCPTLRGRARLPDRKSRLAVDWASRKLRRLRSRRDSSWRDRKGRSRTHHASEGLRQERSCRLRREMAWRA